MFYFFLLLHDNGVLIWHTLLFLCLVLYMPSDCITSNPQIWVSLSLSIPIYRRRLVSDSRSLLMLVFLRILPPFSFLHPFSLFTVLSDAGLRW